MPELHIQPIQAETAIVRPVWSILSKGVHGTGKTILSCGKEFRPTYVFNLEGRFESVLTYYRKLDGHVKDLAYNDFHMGSGYYALDKQMDALVARPMFKTVVVSSLTSFIHIILKHLIEVKFGMKRQSGQQAGKRIGGIPVNELEDYNAEDASIIFDLLSFLQALKDNGVNVILEAHISPYEVTTLTEDKSRQTQTIFQILTKGKKAPAQVPNYFNEIWHFKKEFAGFGQAAKYMVDTIGDSSMDCKTSFGIPPFEMTGIDPTIKLMEFLNPEIKNNPREDPNKPKVASW